MIWETNTEIKNFKTDHNTAFCPEIWDLMYLWICTLNLGVADLSSSCTWVFTYSVRNFIWICSKIGYFKYFWRRQFIPLLFNFNLSCASISTIRNNSVRPSPRISKFLYYSIKRLSYSRPHTILRLTDYISVKIFSQSCLIFNSRKLILISNKKLLKVCWYENL